MIDTKKLKINAKELTINGKKYAWDPNNNTLYNFEQFKKRNIIEVGKIDPADIIYSIGKKNKRSLINRLEVVVGKKLDKLNLDNKKKLNDTYLQYMEELFAFGGPGYQRAKTRFKKLQLSLKKPSHARSFTKSKKKSISRTKRKTIGGIKIRK